MPMWFIGWGKTTRTLQPCGGSEQIQPNKRFTLLGAQFIRISLMSRATWRNICLAAAAPPGLPSPLHHSRSFLNKWKTFSFLFQFQVGSVSLWQKNLCFFFFFSEYNTWSDWSCSRTMALCTTALCTTKEEETTFYWEDASVFIHRVATVELLFKWSPQSSDCYVTIVATRWQVQKFDWSLTGGQFFYTMPAV